MVSRNSASEVYDEEARLADAVGILPAAMKICARYRREVVLIIILNGKSDIMKCNGVECMRFDGIFIMPESRMISWVYIQQDIISSSVSITMNERAPTATLTTNRHQRRLEGTKIEGVGALKMCIYRKFLKKPIAVPPNAKRKPTLVVPQRTRCGKKRRFDVRSRGWCVA